MKRFLSLLLLLIPLALFGQEKSKTIELKRDLSSATVLGADGKVQTYRADTLNATAYEKEDGSSVLSVDLPQPPKKGQKISGKIGYDHDPERKTFKVYEIERMDHTEGIELDEKGAPLVEPKSGTREIPGDGDPGDCACYEDPCQGHLVASAWGTSLIYNVYTLTIGGGGWHRWFDNVMHVCKWTAYATTSSCQASNPASDGTHWALQPNGCSRGPTIASPEGFWAVQNIKGAYQSPDYSGGNNPFFLTSTLQLTGGEGTSGHITMTTTKQGDNRAFIQGVLTYTYDNTCN